MWVEEREERSRVHKVVERGHEGSMEAIARQKDVHKMMCESGTDTRT